MTDLTFRDPKSLVNRAAFNERFSVLNGLYQYWWKRRALVSSYTEVKTEKHVNSLSTGDTGDFIIRLHDDSGVNNVYSITADLEYSDKINIDQSNGEITLVSPKTISGISARSVVSTELSSITGKYVQSKTVKKNGGTVDNGIYLIPDVMPENIAAGLAGTVMWGAWTDPMYKITSKKVIDKGDWEYIFSDDRSAYPDSGEQNGYEYQFLGIPFENAREASRATLTSYIGTGKYGESSPCSVSANFILSACMILSHVDLANLIQENSSAANRIMYADELTTEYVKSRGLCGNVNYIPGDTSYGKKSEDGKTFYWYNEKGASEQLNEKGIKYYILLFG